MSYCPLPAKTKKTNFTTPAKKTVYAPPPRVESCAPSQSTIIGGGGSDTTNEIYVPGPAGPKGDKGDQGIQGWGFKWEGQFELNKEYKKQSEDNPLASVVEWMGSSYVALEDNISGDEDNPEFEPGTSSAWGLVAKAGEGSLPEKEKGIFDYLAAAADWIENASIEDLILAGIAGVGIVVAGAKVVDMITDTGEGDGEADARYTGSPGYVKTAYVSPKVAEVVSSLCAIEGIDHDVSELHDEDCSLVIGQHTSIRQVLSQLALAYQFKMVSSGGIIKFSTRTTTPVATITLADMGMTGDTTSAPPAPYTTQRFQGIELPKRATVEYMSEDLDYNTFTQSADFYTFPDGQVLNLSVPVALSHEKAKQIAENAIVNAHLQRMQYGMKTNYKFLRLDAGDVVLAEQLGLIELSTLVEDSEGLLQWTAFDAGVPEANVPSNLEVVTPPPSTNIPSVVSYSQGFFIDPPNIDSNDRDVRIYVAVHGYDVPGWPGAAIYSSQDNGATYQLEDYAYEESTVGLVEAATPAHDYHTWDDDTEIIVQVKTNQLNTVPDIDVLNGKNWALIGQEMIGFARAELIAEKTYKLSRLLRGRQGTEQLITKHVANELFVLIDSAPVKIVWDKEDRFSVKKYKIVTIGSSLDKVEAQDIQMFSNNTLMWNPWGAKVVKNGSDFSFSWKERVRFDNNIKDLATTNHDPDWGGYGIIIYDTDGVTKKGTYTMQDENFVYTAAMQTTDFGAPQANIIADIAQISTIYGSGYPTRVNT